MDVIEENMSAWKERKITPYFIERNNEILITHACHERGPVSEGPGKLLKESTAKTH